MTNVIIGSSKFKENSYVDGTNSEKQKTFIADSNPTGFVVKFCCNCIRENNSSESNDESYFSPLGIGFILTACHLPLSQQADGFEILVDSGSSKPYINPELTRGVESRMLEYMKIELHIEIRTAGNNMLHGTA